VTEEFVIHLMRETFYTIMLISAPVLIVSMIIGLIISILQAATSIQEFTLTFVPKMVVVAVIIVITMPWMFDVMKSFTINLFQQIPALIP
jgi:flagellar biosynthetic protein FliQ